MPPLKQDDVLPQYDDDTKGNGTWINKEFLYDILSTKLNNVEVVDFAVSSASNTNENFLGTLYRVNVLYKANGSSDSRSRRIIVKDLPADEAVQQLLTETHTFEKEMEIYSNCIPIFKRVLRIYFPVRTVPVTPDSYKCSRPNTIVMEDLAETGYKMAHRIDQLDFDHSKIALQTLARFHALSLKVNQNHPSIIKKCTKEVFTDEAKENTTKFILQGCPALAQVIETNWKNHKEYAEVIRQIGEYIWELVVECVRPSKYLNVMNHGDLWVNNIMFKYNKDESIHSAKLIDFQVARFTSPVIDLLYFFFTSVQPYVLQIQMDELIEIYHNALLSDTAILNVKVDYTLQNIHEELKERAAFAFAPIPQALAAMLASKPTDNEPKSFGSYAAERLMNQHYQNVVEHYLEHLHNSGLMDGVKELLKQVKKSSKRKDEEKVKNVAEFIGDISDKTLDDILEDAVEDAIEGIIEYAVDQFGKNEPTTSQPIEQQIEEVESGTNAKSEDVKIERDIPQVDQDINGKSADEREETNIQEKELEKDYVKRIFRENKVDSNPLKNFWERLTMPICQ